MPNVRSPLVGQQQGGKPGRSRKLLLGVVAVLAMGTILSIVGVQYRHGMLVLKAPSPMYGEDIVNNGPVDRAVLESFDAGKIYKFDQETDLDHPNRIDEYGCLFSNCGDDSGPGGLLGKGEKWMRYVACVCVCVYVHALFCLVSCCDGVLQR
jgi:hypothetical protein